MELRSRVLEKCCQLDRVVANDFRSSRQFVNGQAPMDNSKFLFDVLNRAIPYALANSPLMPGMIHLANGDRKDGTAKVELMLKTENWDLIQDVLKSFRMKLDEGDLIEYCLKFYLSEVKVKRCLP